MAPPINAITVTRRGRDRHTLMSLPPSDRRHECMCGHLDHAAQRLRRDIDRPSLLEGISDVGSMIADAFKRRLVGCAENQRTPDPRASGVSSSADLRTSWPGLRRFWKGENRIAC